MRVVIYNDTTRAFGRTHFGCVLVMQALHDLLAGAGIEVIGTVTLDDARAGRLDKALLQQADLVVANGEGSYHHDRRPDFAQLARQYPVALVNTVYQANSDDLRGFKYIAARESHSRDEVQHQVPCDLVPDVIFTSSYLASLQPGTGGGTVSVQHYREVNTMQQPGCVCPHIAAADAVRTGSYHAGCVAAYYGKPVALEASNTHKMEGLAADMGIGYGTGEPQRAREGYVQWAQGRIYAMCEKLKGLA